MPDAPRGTTTLPEPAQRGRLVIKDQVVEKIARTAALEVASVLRTSSPLNPLSRSLPHAQVTLTSTHARISLQVASAWDRPLYAVAAEVRAHVAETVHRLTGLDVDTVDVQVGTVVQDPQEEEGGLFGRHRQPERRNLL